MKVLDLFSGIGGFSLGLERAGMETAAFCEIDDFPRQVLKKHWPDVPCYLDVRDLTVEKLESDGITDIGLICGGYPCQPFSQAGKRGGKDDDRHLWPEMYRLIRTLRPRWVIGENVAGHISMGLDEVLADLESENYTCWPLVIPACAVDARHRRDRVWILAADTEYLRSAQQQRKHQRPAFADRGGSNEVVAGGSVGNADRGVCKRRSDQPGRQPQGRVAADRAGQNVADTISVRWRRVQQQSRLFQKAHEARTDAPGGDGSDRGDRPGGESRQTESVMGGLVDGLPDGLAGCRWLPEPGTPRVTDGVPDRIKKLRGLGNAVVPQVVEILGHAIMEIEESENDSA